MGRIYCALKDSHRVDSDSGHWSFPLLGVEHGCVNQCASGISYYAGTQFTPDAVHGFQEGFLVLSGTGEARVDGEVFALEPMVSFLVPAWAGHTLRSVSPEEPLVLFWFHAGI